MSSSQRRPPNLKSLDRAVSVIVDDYSPRQSGSFSLSPRPSNAMFADQQQHQHLNIQRSTESVGKMTSPSDRSLNKRQKSLFRGETIDLMDLPSTSSTSLKQSQRQTEYNMDIADCNPISRHYSIRHPKRNAHVNQTSLISKQQQQQDSLAIPAFHSNHPSPQKMYSPFKDVHTFSTSPIRVEATNSFIIDDQMPGTSSSIVIAPNISSPYDIYDKPRPKLPPKQKSISYFDELEDLNKKYSSDLHRLSVRVSAESASRQVSSSNSLERIISSNSPRLQATRSAEKLLRRHQTVTSMNQHLKAPIPLSNNMERSEQQQRQPYSFKSVGETIKKSQSFRYKQPRESSVNENRELFKSRKSKSFVNSVDDMDYICTLPAELSPNSNYPMNFSKAKHHRPAASPMSDRKMFIDELRGLSGDGADLLPENSAQAVKIDFGALDFNTIYKSYRAQQKTTLAGRKSFDSPSSPVGRINGPPGQFKYSGKRKKVAITILVITFCVVLFAATAVIVTLTNSNGSQVHNQTRQTLTTTTRDSRPIHFGGGFSGIN